MRKHMLDDNRSIVDITREHVLEEAGRNPLEQKQYECPLGCDERSDYYPHQYHEYKCYHQNTLNQLPYMIRHRDWLVAEDDASNGLVLHTQMLEMRFKSLRELPYIPSGWQTQYNKQYIKLIKQQQQ